jgi:biopolymer transport protein ExbD
MNISFKFRCPSCNAEREATKKIVGRRVRCPQCGHVSRVEEPENGDGAIDEDFDAYYHWLAIPPGEQPPNHYRLLGVALFEPDEDVIAISADRQMVHVKAQATGRYSHLSQQLLNELAKARTCLLDAKRRKEYDDKLRADLAAKSAKNAKPAGKATPVAVGTRDARATAAAPAGTASGLVPLVAPGLTPIDAPDLTRLAVPALTPLAPVGRDAQWKGRRKKPPTVPPTAPAADEEELPPKPRKAYESDLDMTPMVDMTFLLLIFFMVTAAFSIKKSMQLPPPKPDEVSNVPVESVEDNPDYVQVFVDEFNTYHVTTPDWEEEAPSEHDLLIKLRRAREGSGDGNVPTKLLVTAHADSLYEKVVAALDAGAQVGLQELSVAMTDEEMP